MNKRELAELALDLGLDFDKESGIIYGRRRDYAFYLETITDGDEFAIFFSVRCEQGYIGRDTLEALINDSEVLIDFELSLIHILTSSMRLKMLILAMLILFNLAIMIRFDFTALWERRLQKVA